MTRGGSVHKIRFAKKEGKQNRGFKKKASNQVRGGLRKERVSWNGGGGADGAPDTASLKEDRKKQKGRHCVSCSRNVLLSPKNKPVLCEGAQQDRRNTRFLHGG